LYALPGLSDMVVKLAVLSDLTISDTEPASNKSFISGTEKYFVEFEQEMDVEAEIEKLTKELEYQKGFLRGVDTKLSNERFVAGAPSQVLENERKKQADTMARIGIIEESLRKLQ